MESLSKKNIELLNRVQKHLEENYAQDLTITEVSKHFGTNTLILKRGFKKSFKITFHQFIVEKRMEKAIEMLKSNDLSIVEISEKVGYKYVTSFSKVVKKKFGSSPSKLLEQKDALSKRKFGFQNPTSKLELLEDENRRLREIIENQTRIFSKFLSRPIKRVA